MGACSSKPKTAEFEGNMNFYIQEELAGKNLDDEQKGDCEAGLKNLETEQKISSKRSLQNLQPAMENEHDSMGDVRLESEKECLARSSLENKEKESHAIAEGTCDVKHHFVAEGECQVPEIGTEASKLQKEKSSAAQELYEELAFAQKEEDFLGSHRNSIMFEEVVVGLPQKVALRYVENGKFQTLVNINEDEELPMFQGGKLRIDAKEGNPASCRALQEPDFLASRVANADFKLKINPAGHLMNSRTEKIADCSATGRAANGVMLLYNGESGDVILEKPSKPEGLEYGAQRHDLEEASKEQSALLIVSKAQDNEWKNLNFMVAPLAIKENDASNLMPPALIGLPDVNAFSNGSLGGAGIKVDEFACIDISPSALKYNGKEAGKQVKSNMATSMIDELPCHLPNFTELHAKHSTSADENFGVHETENPLIDLVNTKVEDDSMAWEWVNEASGMIPGEDGAQVGLKEGSQTSGLSKECNEASCSIQGEEYASKQEHDLIFCPDEIVLKVVDKTKEQVIDYERHSTAFQPLQTFEEPHVVEPPRSIYGRDMDSDIDDMLEKLASEFVRQETLSSFLP